jgi:hypothetical protein
LKTAALLNLSIYPNPGNGKLNLDYDFVNGQDVQIEIYNLLGETVYSAFYRNWNQGIQSIDISNLKNSAYLVRVSSEEFMHTFKYLKK